MSNAPHPTDPAVMNGVIPYLLMVGRAAEACDFYARAFGAKGLGRMPFPDGKPGLIHAQIEINGGALKSSVSLDPWVVSVGVGRKF